MNGPMDPNKYSMFAQGSAPSDLTTSFGTGAAAKGAAAGGFDPLSAAVMVGLDAYKAYQQGKEMERQEKFAANQDVNNRMSRALSSLVNISQGFRI